MDFLVRKGVRPDPIFGAPKPMDRVKLILDHMQHFGVTQVSITISGDDIAVTINGDVLGRELAHLGMERVERVA